MIVRDGVVQGGPLILVTLIEILANGNEILCCLNISIPVPQIFPCSLALLGSASPMHMVANCQLAFLETMIRSMHGGTLLHPRVLMLVAKAMHTQQLFPGKSC